MCSLPWPAKHFLSWSPCGFHGEVYAWRVSISENTEWNRRHDLLPLKRIDEEVFLTWIINNNRLLDYTFGKSLLFVCNFLECKGRNNFHCLNKLNDSEQVSVKTAFMRRFMAYSHCMETALGSVQRTTLVRWETMGSGRCPCVGPVLTSLHSTVLYILSL